MARQSRTTAWTWTGGHPGGGGLDDGSEKAPRAALELLIRVAGWVGDSSAQSCTRRRQESPPSRRRPPGSLRTRARDHPFSRALTTGSAVSNLRGNLPVRSLWSRHMARSAPLVPLAPSSLLHDLRFYRPRPPKPTCETEGGARRRRRRRDPGRGRVSLTSVARPLAETATHAVALLRHRLDGTTTPSGVPEAVRLLTPHLVVHSSTT